ncbi:MAG TPA: DUF937 domain-containing protein [Cyclobacteriaceae bacterium]|nr:DUF937 domain-containing protein [Cyclobacteriaceae bacterium]HPW62960.1 DUF937 domain-containing protein [Cyclobacteriaceae bacterium]
MLDQLVKLVEQNAGDAIIKNQAIPNQFNNAAIQEVAGSIFNTLKSQAAQGNLQQVAAMFQGGTSQSNLANNPMVKQMIASVAGNFAAKFGVSSAQAQSIVAGLLPTVMNQLVKKTNDPKDNSFDLTDVMKSVSGNNNLDVTSIIGQLAGGNAKSNPLGALGGLAGKFFGKK